MPEQDSRMMEQMMETLKEEEKMTPKQVKILQAAIEIIAEKGYYNTATSEIAQRAGVAEGTIFRHYRTKKDLLAAIVKPTITKFAVSVFAAQFVDQVMHERYERFEDFLFAFVSDRFEFAKANVPLLKIVLQEMAFHPEIQAVYKNIFQEKVYPAINNVLEHFKAAGEIRDIPNVTIIRLTIPTILGFLITRLLLQPQKDWDDEAEIRETIQLIMNGIGSHS